MKLTPRQKMRLQYTLCGIMIALWVWIAKPLIFAVIVWVMNEPLH